MKTFINEMRSEKYIMEKVQYKNEKGSSYK